MIPVQPHWGPALESFEPKGDLLSEAELQAGNAEEFAHDIVKAMDVDGDETISYATPCKKVMFFRSIFSFSARAEKTFPGKILFPPKHPHDLAREFANRDGKGARRCTQTHHICG